MGIGRSGVRRGGGLKAGVMALLVGAAFACAAPRPEAASLRLHDPEPTGSELEPPQRLSGEMPDLSGLFGPGVRTSTCDVAATVTSDGDLRELEWEKANHVDSRFRSAVERAMATWKFRPATFLGQPASVPIRFELDRCPLVPQSAP